MRSNPGDWNAAFASAPGLRATFSVASTFLDHPLEDETRSQSRRIPQTLRCKVRSEDLTIKNSALDVSFIRYPVFKVQCVAAVKLATVFLKEQARLVLSKLTTSEQYVTALFIRSSS